MSNSSHSDLNPFSGKPFSDNYHAVRLTAEQLPISKQMPDLLDALKQSTIMILVGETGSGKTTQFPQNVLRAHPELIKTSGRKVVITQNRRLATMQVGKRIAEELDVPLGDAVGLRMRGLNQTTAATRLEVVTDSTLLAAAKADPLLTDYAVIIIDEAHQHTIATDLLLGHLKCLMKKRPNDLKFIIISATIQTKSFANFFPGSIVKEVIGREHPVHISYLAQPPSDLNATIIETIIQLHLTEQSGNILVFASGTREISQIIRGVQNVLEGKVARFDESVLREMGPLHCYPLHAQLPSEMQDLAVESVAPAGEYGKPGRKLIVATNIAATLLDSHRFGCSDEIISVVAMIEATEGGYHLFVGGDTPAEKNAIKEIRDKFLYQGSDHLTLFNVYMAWRQSGVDGTQEDFLKENMLHGSVLRAADATRKQLMKMLVKQKGWEHNSLDPRNQPRYDSLILQALATGNFLHVAKRNPSSTPNDIRYETVRLGIDVKLQRETQLGPMSEANEWVFYNECNIKDSRKTIRLVSAIAPELLVTCQPTVWWDVERLREGHIKEAMLKVLVKLTGLKEEEIRGGMPTAPSAPSSQ